MAIELTDDDLAAIRAQTVERLKASSVEYALLTRSIPETLREYPKAKPHVVLCCALYQSALAQCSTCIELLDERRANAQTLCDLIQYTTAVWGALGALLKVLHGGGPPLLQTSIDEQVRLNRSQSASHAARAKLNQPGGYAEKRQRVRELWATGKYPSRDECASKVHKTVGLSLSATRKALRKAPDVT
jgi:hypothetical protein